MMYFQIKKSSDALLKSDARADQNQVIFFTSPNEETPRVICPPDLKAVASLWVFRENYSKDLRHFRNEIEDTAGK